MAARSCASFAGPLARRSHRKNSTLPDGPGSRLRVTPRIDQPSRAAAAATLAHRVRAQSRVADHAAGAQPLPADLELRLDHRQQIAVRRGAGDQRRQHDRAAR